MTGMQEVFYNRTPSTLLRVIALIFVIAVPFAAFSTAAVNCFYRSGAMWGDAGVIAYVIWHTNGALSMPALSGSTSYFTQHITPVFWLLNLASRVLPFTKVQFFAVFSGVCYTLPGLAVYRLLTGTYNMRSGHERLAAALVSVLFAFNGIALAAARNPHFEMLIVGSGMMFFVSILQRRFVSATFWFSLCVATREDAGFELFLLLVVHLLLHCRQWPPLRAQLPLILYAAASLGYGVLAICLQRLFFPSSHQLSAVYTGWPPFQALGWGQITDRLAFYVVDRGYIFWPLYLAVAWAIRSRNPYIAAGYAAMLPWGLLSLLAVSPYAGTLSSYYAFPFIFASFWPLLGPAMAGRPAIRPVLGFLLLTLASFTDLGVQQNAGGVYFPESFLASPSLARQRATDSAITAFVHHSAMLGKVAVDGGIAALAPDAFSPAELVWARQSHPPDTVVFYVRGQGRPFALRLASQAGLQNTYEIPNTSILVLSNRDLQGLGGLVPVVSGGDYSVRESQIRKNTCPVGSGPCA